MNTQLEQPGNYEFAAAPQPLGAKGKYRDQNDQGGAYLLMDKGNRSKGFQQQAQKTGNMSKSEGQFMESDEAFQTNNPNTNYLEPLQDDIEDENEIEPDFYVDRPPTPEFKPKERGIDVSTQIVDTELFDFQLEVEPILQVLVGKTVDQARMELIEEYEQAELKKHKAQFEIKRNAELMVTQRMEAAYIRRQEEKERRNWQHKLNRDQQKFAHKKLISRQLIKRALSDLKQNSLNDLENQGFLRDQMILKLKANFLPWVLNTTIDFVQNTDSIEHQLEEFAEELQNELADQHKANLEKEKNRRDQILREREVQRQKKEEYKRKKEEWKRKTQIHQERQLILDFIYENIINKAEKIDNIRECEFVDITGDNRRVPVTSIFGGLLSQIWLAVESANLILQENPLTQNQIRDIVDIVLREFKHGLTIKFSETQKEFYDELVKQLSEATENISEAREQFINNLLSNEELYINDLSTLSYLRKIIETRNGSTQTFKEILKILLEYHAKNIKPDPVDEQKSKEEHNSSISHQRGSMNDLDDKLYRQKIKILFENTNEYIRNNVNVIIRLRVPFLTQQEMEKIRQEAEKQIQEEQKSQNNSQVQQEQEEGNYGAQENQNEQEAQGIQEEAQQEQEQEQQPEEEEEKCKYDVFVETFDGEGYKRNLIENLSSSQRRPLNEDHPSQINIWVNEERRFLYFDERTLFYLEAVLHKVIRDVLGNKVEPINASQFSQQFDDIHDCLLENFLGEVYEEEKIEKIPIFDIDFGFNLPAD
ncbi:hypothetical protein ABPG72_001630 [Tetrahymena utriculariae]